MVRFLANAAVALVTAALALLLAAWVVPGVTLRPSGFLVAVAVFTAMQAVFAPLVYKFARKYAEGLVGGFGIVSTLLALIIAAWIPSGLSIHGVPAWIVTPLVVWFVTGLAGWILMTFVVNRWLKKREEQKLAERVKRAK